MRARDDRLRLHVNSVVCRENLDEMVRLGEMLRDRFDLDGHYLQIIRGRPMDPGLLEVHKEALELYRIASIRRDGCWCTHVCFIHASLKASLKARAIDVPRAYLAARS